MLQKSGIYRLTNLITLICQNNMSEMKNESVKKIISKKNIVASNYAFDVNSECYCSLCEKHYTNYKRFVIHIKKAKHYDYPFDSNQIDIQNNNIRK